MSIAEILELLKSSAGPTSPCPFCGRPCRRSPITDSDRPWSCATCAGGESTTCAGCGKAKGTYPGFRCDPCEWAGRGISLPPLPRRLARLSNLERLILVKAGAEGRIRTDDVYEQYYGWRRTWAGWQREREGVAPRGSWAMSVDPKAYRVGRAATARAFRNLRRRGLLMRKEQRESWGYVYGYQLTRDGGYWLASCVISVLLTGSR